MKRDYSARVDTLYLYRIPLVLRLCRANDTDVTGLVNLLPSRRALPRFCVADLGTESTGRSSRAAAVDNHNNKRVPFNSASSRCRWQREKLQF